MTTPYTAKWNSHTRKADVLRDGHPVACGFPTVTDATIWIEKRSAVKALFEEPRSTDTEAMALLRRFLTTLPADHKDRPGTIRSLEILEHYGKEAK